MLNKDPALFCIIIPIVLFLFPVLPIGAFCGTSAMMRRAGEQLTPELTPAGLEDWQALNSPLSTTLEIDFIICCSSMPCPVSNGSEC